jgi:hypothetical protein
MALALTACGVTTPTETPAATNLAPPPPLQPLSYPAVSAKPEAESTLPLFFAVDRAFLNDAVERWVPTRLHEEKGREVGPGTTLDLVVTRRQPTLAVKDETLALEVPLALSIDVKSRLGPIELNLGHCGPEVNAKVTLPTRLQDDLSLPAPNLSLELKQPCRLSGFDVTALLTQELQKQQARGEKELRAGVRRASKILSTQAQGLGEVLDATDPVCPRFLPRQIVQSPLEERASVLSASLSLRGTLVSSCAAPPPITLSVEHSKRRLPFVLVESRLVVWETLSRELGPILKAHGLEAEPHRWSSAVTPRGERLALGLRGEKSSGWVFLTAVVQNGTLRLLAEHSDNPELLRALQSLLVGLTVPCDVTRAESLAKKLFTQTSQRSQVHLKEPELRRRLVLEVEALETAVDTAIVPEGVRLLVQVRERNR